MEIEISVVNLTSRGTDHSTVCGNCCSMGYRLEDKQELYGTQANRNTWVETSNERGMMMMMMMMEGLCLRFEHRRSLIVKSGKAHFLMKSK